MSARIDPTFRAKIDARVEALRMLPPEGLTFWLLVEHLFDSLHVAADPAEQLLIANARRLYHLRVQAIEAANDPLALWTAFLKAYEEAMRHA